MEVAAGTWCNKCMGPARLGEQRLLLTSCSHIICDACVRSMDHSENICAACKSECQAVVVTSENFGEQSPEIQDVLAPRASETILDQAIQRVARIEHFKRQQFRDQIIVQQQKHTDHGKHLQTLSRDNQQLQQENKKLRQENKRLQRGHAVPGTSSSSSARPMTGHSVSAEAGFFAQSTERSSRPRTQSAERSSRPRTGHSSGRNPTRPRTAAPSASPSSFARPGTRGGVGGSGSAKGSQLLHQTPPRRPYTPGDSAQSAVGQVLGGMSDYQQSAPEQSPGAGEWTAGHKGRRHAEHGQRVDRFEAARGMNDVKSPGTASMSSRGSGGSSSSYSRSTSLPPQGYAPSPAVSRQRPARFTGGSAR